MYSESDENPIIRMYGQAYQSTADRRDMGGEQKTNVDITDNMITVDYGYYNVEENGRIVGYGSDASLIIRERDDIKPDKKDPFSSLSVPIFYVRADFENVENDDLAGKFFETNMYYPEAVEYLTEFLSFVKNNGRRSLDKLIELTNQNA